MRAGRPLFISHFTTESITVRLSLYEYDSRTNKYILYAHTV
jgi:hypothetical protein